MTRSKPGRSRFERLMFTFMGPPQLGGGASTAAPDGGADRCPRCEQPWDDHERVRSSSRSYLRCP